MSSPFQKSFSAKSPITTSPLRAGGYGSGVDGMQYVSPKQPESNILPASKPKKEEKTPEPKPILPRVPGKKHPRIYDDFGDDSSDDGGGDGNYLLEEQDVEDIEKGATVERFAKTPEEKAKYKAYKKKCKAEGNCNTKYRDKVFSQHQQRETINSVTGEWVNVGERKRIK